MMTVDGWCCSDHMRCMHVMRCTYDAIATLIQAIAPVRLTEALHLSYAHVCSGDSSECFGDCNCSPS